MTAELTDRVPAVVGHPALSRCVAGDLSRFASDVWGRQPWLSKAADLPGDFADLLDADAVDELVSRRGLRTPFLRVAKAGSTLAEQAFTSPGGVGAAIADQLDDDKLLKLFADGSTLVLQALHRTWPPLVDYALDLAGELGHPVQVNAYVTPAQSQGFSDHYDVFVLQVDGEKRWVIRPPVHQAPLRDQPWTGRRREVEAAAAREPVLDAVLEPGDCLYLPRGYLHSATALGGVSIHLTVGVHTWTRHALAESLVAAALRDLAGDVDVRQSLPMGVDVGDPAAISADLALVRERLVTLLRDVPVDEVARRMDRAAVRSQRPSPVSPLAQVRTATDLDGDTAVALRPHLHARLETDATGAVLRSRAGDVRIESAELPALERLLTGQPLRVDELPLDVDLSKPLMQRLVRAGVLVRPTA